MGEPLCSSGGPAVVWKGSFLYAAIFAVIVVVLGMVLMGNYGIDG